MRTHHSLPTGPVIVVSPRRWTCPTASHRRRVLVVDDHPGAGEALARLLGIVGHEVRLARTGRDALRIAARFDPDVVLIDLSMPGMNGTDVARHLRRSPRSSSAVLIAVSGWGRDDPEWRTRDAGFDFHLQKPVDLASLESLIERA